MPANRADGPRRAALLVRVSTTHLEQADSPLHQLGYLREEMNRSGWTDSGLVYEAELTGAVILDRPDIRRMIADAGAGGFDAILLKSISRLGRDTLGLLMVKRLLDDLGVELVALSDGYRSFRDPELIFLVHAERAQAGRQEISKNVKAGVAQAARRGIWPAGTLPFGYLRQSRFTVAIDSETAQVVRQIFALRKEGRGGVAICRHLNGVLRVKAPRWWQLGEQIRRLSALDPGGTDPRVQERIRHLRTERVSGSFLWHPRTIRLILNNPAYHGELRYNRTTGERRMHGRLVRRPRDAADWVTIPCPPLVSREDWDLAQAVAAERERLPRRSGGSRFLLSGLAACGLCGSALRAVGARPGAGGRGGDPVGYYVCRASVEAGAHTPAYVRAGDLERAVLEQMRGLLRGLPNPPPGPLVGRRPDPAKVEAELRAELADLAAARFFRREELRKGRMSAADFDYECGLLREREAELRRRLTGPQVPAFSGNGSGPGERLVRLEGERESVRLLLATLVERVVVYSADLAEVRMRFTAEELASAPGSVRYSDIHADTTARPTTP